MTSNFYIYGLFDPVNGELRYIGKCQTSLYRRLQSHKAPSQVKLHTHRSNWIHNLLIRGTRPEICLIQELSNSDELCLAEKYWIKYFKDCGCRLTNLTEGGEGAPGHLTSEMTKSKISASLRGNQNARGFKHTRETKLKMSKAVTGIKRSRETKMAMSIRASISNLGNKNTLGYKPTKETIELLRVAGTGRRHTVEARAKMSKAAAGRLAWNIGIPQQEKTKRKISAAMKQYFKNKDPMAG